MPVFGGTCSALVHQDAVPAGRTLCHIDIFKSEFPQISKDARCPPIDIVFHYLPAHPLHAHAPFSEAHFEGAV